MAPTFTVKEVRTSERDRLTVELAAQQLELASSSVALAGAVETTALATKAASDLERDASVLRQQIADPATTPGELHQLEQQLLQNLLVQAAQSHDLAAAQDAVARLDLTLKRASARVDRAKAQLAQAEAALAEAKLVDAQTNAWRATLGGPALAAIVADAASQSSTDLIAAVETRLKVFVRKPELYTLLGLRLADAQGAADEPGRAASRALAALDSLRASFDLVDGVVYGLAAEFGETRTTARLVAENAEQDLAAAKATLQRALTEPGPTVGEQTLIDTRADLVTAAPNAVPKETDLHNAWLAERAALADLEDLSLPALAADPLFDVANDPLTQQAFDDHATAAQAVTAAEAAFTAAMRTKVDAWEVGVPPRIMLLVTDALRATATVKRVKALTPAQVLADLDAAEEAYAQALDDQDQARALVQEAGDEAAARADDAAALQPVADRRVAAGVRGED